MLQCVDVRDGTLRRIDICNDKCSIVFQYMRFVELWLLMSSRFTLDRGIHDYTQIAQLHDCVYYDHFGCDMAITVQLNHIFCLIGKGVKRCVVPPLYIN